MIRVTVSLVFAAGLAIAIGPGSLAAIRFESCRLAGAGGRLETPARCATLPVALNPADPGSGSIGLRIAVVDALAEDPLGDPLLIIAGGPGQAATTFYSELQGAFEPIHRRRDIVLIDQRGTGGSAALDCPANESPGGLDADDTLRAMHDCREALGVDPRWFTTSLAVGDLERVRAALGYRQWNVYAVSYGTRVALHYLRRHPGAARRVILDGVLPPDVPLGPDIPGHAQRALEHLFARCRQDPACAAAWPRLGTRFAALLARLAAAPVAVAAMDPRSGERRTFTLHRMVPWRRRCCSRTGSSRARSPKA